MDGVTECDVAVIGAGLAGLACARALADAGLGVQVLDKGRGLGGRLATRRFDGGQADHGAPAIHPRPDAPPEAAADFARFVSATRAAGAAAWWPAAGGDVGLPGMSRLTGPLAKGLKITHQAEVTALAPLPGGGGWQLARADGGAALRAARVVLAIPQPQALRLLGAWPALAARIAGASMAPALVAIAAFAAPLPTALTHARFADGPLASARREGARPGRAALPDAWVLEASATWTAAHLEAEKDQIATGLLAALGPALGLQGPLPQPVYLAGHRWRHARTDRPLGVPCVLDSDAGIGLCGDWCLGPEAGAAYESGRAMAAALLA